MHRLRAFAVLAALGFILAGRVEAKPVTVKVSLEGDRDVKRQIEKGIEKGLAGLRDVRRGEKNEDCEIQVIAFNVQSQGRVKLGYAVTAVFLQPVRLQGLKKPIRHFLGVWTQTGPYESLVTHGESIARYYAKNIHPSLSGNR